MRIKRHKIHHVARGWLTGQGASKTDARADLDRQVDWACAVASPVIECWHGLIVVVAATPGGYSTAVFNPADLAHGKQRACTSIMPQGEYTDALESARSHAAQWAWRVSETDDTGFVARSGLSKCKAIELADWIQWQRRYATAKANGATDCEAHATASGYRQAA